MGKRHSVDMITAITSVIEPTLAPESRTTSAPAPRLVMTATPAQAPVK